MGVRDDLAAAIAAKVQPTYPQVQVYGHPEDVTQVPAIVLVPGDPWAQVGGFGSPGTGVVRWAFQVSLVGHRAAVESTIELMEALRELVAQAVSGLGGRWMNLGQPQQTVLAGIDVLAATMDIELMTERQT